MTKDTCHRHPSPHQAIAVTLQGLESTIHDTHSPTAPPPLTGWRLAREIAGVGQIARLVVRAPVLLRTARGNGTPVVVVPGFGAGDGSTVLLRHYLSLIGYEVTGWGLGRNRGNVRRLIPRVTALAVDRATSTGRSVHLVGWSLGGYLAREAARERPDAVAQVVTLGSPVVGGPKYTATATAYRRAGYDLEVIEATVAERNKTPIQVPITAIFSRSDLVVDWRACIDQTSPSVDHVEVSTTHLGLGFCPEVYRTIAERLAR